MSESLPWSHAVAWSALGAGEKRLRLSPDAEARERLARFLGVVRLDRLDADVTVRGWLDGMEIEGRVTGAARRTCGVSLEDFDETIDAPVMLRAVPVGSPHAPAPTEGDVEIDLEADDPPDVVEGDHVDVAGYVTEIFALALDPFPRKLGAVFAPPPESAPRSPFAVLQTLSPKSLKSQ
jgi:hypothetical protein